MILLARVFPRLASVGLNSDCLIIALFASVLIGQSDLLPMQGLVEDTQI